MKRILIFLLFISFWSTGQEGLYPHAPNLTTENLKGAVRSVEEKGFIGIEQNGEYVASRPGWEHPWQTDTKSAYDPQGNLIKIDAYVDGNIEPFKVFTYKNGKLIESILPNSHHVFEYDSFDKITVEHYESRQLEIDLSDKEDPPVKTTSIKIDYIYDTSGNLVIKKGSDFENLVQLVDSFFYDNQNRPIKVLSYYDDYIDFQFIHYDSIGNILQLEMGDNEDGLTEKTYYSYENNQMTVENWLLYTDDLPNGGVVYYYENGNEIKSIETEPDDDSLYVTEIAYDFDQKGNWIKKTIKASDDENVYVITRNIEYY